MKVSQMVNSCSVTTSTPCRKYAFKNKGHLLNFLDSDSEEESIKRSVANSQKQCDFQSREQQQEELEKSSKKSKTENPKSPESGNSGLETMSEDELLAAVLEISKREASLSSHDEDKPTNSPDTGFGDDEMQELPDNTELKDAEKSKAAAESGYANLTKVTKDFDENKENKTPEGTQGDVDWLQQYDMEREREEQELQQALAQSLQEQQEAREQKEDDDLKRATELSLQGILCSILFMLFRV
uniref:Uncharacterized protein n=1 Tax=Micrurus surinamensis TaxID=129470 RepID=A0A2D4PFJ8_MICSU